MGKVSLMSEDLQIVGKILKILFFTQSYSVLFLTVIADSLGKGHFYPLFHFFLIHFQFNLILVWVLFCYETEAPNFKLLYKIQFKKTYHYTPSF